MRPSRRTKRDWCSRRYQNGSGLLSRPGDFMVGHDDAVVHGEVRDNLLLVVDLLLVVQHEVFFIPCTPSSFSSLVFFRPCLFFRTYQSSFQTSLIPVSVSIANSNHPRRPRLRGDHGLCSLHFDFLCRGRTGRAFLPNSTISIEANSL